MIVDGGINTKTDDKLVGPGENLILENVEYNEIGAINKRNGFDQLTDSTGSGGTLSTLSPIVVAEHNSELLALSKPGVEGCFSYNPTDLEWNAKGTTEELSPIVFVDDKFVDKVNSFKPFSAELPNSNKRVVGYVTYNENIVTQSYSIKVFIQDTITKEKKLIRTISKSGVGVSIQGLQIRALDIANPTIFIIYSDFSAGTYTIRVLVVDKDGTQLFSHVGLTYPVAAGSMAFGSCIVNNNVFIVHNHDTVAKIRCLLFNGTTGESITAQSFAINKNVFSAGETCFSCVPTGTKVYVSFNNDDVANQITFMGFETVTNLIVNHLAEVYYGSPLADYKVKRLTTILELNNTSILCIYELNATPLAFNNPLNTQRVRISDGIRIGASYYQNFMSIVGGLFRIDSSTNNYFIGQSSVINQERYYICKVPLISDVNSIKIIGTFAVNGQAIIEKKSITGGVVSSRYSTAFISEVSVGENGHFYYPSLYVTREIGLFASTATDNKNLIGSLYINRFEFDSEYSGINAKLGGNTYFSGSLIREYDGINFLEQGFIDSNFISLAETANAGMAAGTYQYTGIYEYLDSNGQIHRSAPFKIAEITTVGAHSVNIYYLQSTLINLAVAVSGKPVSIVFYRTKKNGTTFYRLGGTTRVVYLYGATANPYEDSALDSDLDSAEQLYNSNGILDNDILPPSKHLSVANNRIFSISSEDENRIDYSQPYLEGECVNFSALLSFRIDMGLLSKSGIGKATASLDGKIIIFKDQSIAYITGNGPNQAGLQNDFSDPKLISSDVGIADVKSIVSIPDGIMFKSNKGIYLLDRSLQLTYIGFQVEDYNSESVVGAVVIKDKHMALFMTTSRTMVYDFLQKKWMIWTISGKAIATYQGNPVYIDNTNRIRLFNPTSYLDITSRYSMKLVTPWIKLSGIQNFQRIYKLMILGTYYSQHVLNVKSYYDYDETDFDSYVVSPLVTDNIYQYDVSIVKQKGQAMKFEISDTSTSGTNKSFKLSNLTMILGQKKGTNKTPDTRKY